MMNSPIMLLRQDEVKTDLQLTDDQKNKLAEIQSGMRQKFMDAMQNVGEDQAAREKAGADVMKSVSDEIYKVLTADQQKRLKELNLQKVGYPIIATDKDLQNQLGLSDAEKAKIAALNDQADAANKAVGAKLQSQEIQMDDARAAFTKNSEALKSGIEGILSADEKAKFKTLQGKPFAGTFQTGFGGGRG